MGRTTRTDRSNVPSLVKAASKKKASRWQLVKLWVIRALVSFLIISISLVLALRWINPPTTAIRLIRAIEARSAGLPFVPASCWQNLEALGPNVALAVIASEDQRFDSHYGFDLTELSKAVKSSGRKRGASTISQQVAKNLFLWHGRSYLRKGMEAYFTGLIEIFWSKRRTLEVYLNIVEFGEQRFGACAGAKGAFGVAPIRLSPYQAGLLAASLPNPHVYSAKKPTAKMHQRASWIVRQMQQLGGAQYLAQL
jgi:monofunctional glycosyltransferase